MSVLLVFPPKGDLAQPFLSMPTLSGYLRAQGVSDVQTRDLNIEFHDWMTQPAQLKRAAAELPKIQRFVNRPGAGEGVRHAFDAAEQQMRLQLLTRIAPQLIDECERTKAICRGQHGQVTKTERNRSISQLIQAFDLAMVPFFPGSLDLLNVRIASYSHSRTEDLREAISDASKNPMIPFLEQTLLAELRSAPPRLVGVSLAYEEQLWAGLTLARMVREASPRSRVVFGGSLITRIVKKLINIDRLAALVDAFVVRDGEEPLVALERWSRGEGRLEDIPNLFYRDAGEIRETEHRTLTDPKKIATPDYSGMPLDLYFSPVTILPIEHARGCYWNRCTFCYRVTRGACGQAFENHREYRPRGASAIVNDMRNLLDLHDTRDVHFTLVDDALGPATFRRLADELQASNVKTTWMVRVRMEPGFTEELFKRAHDSGCKAVYFGLESASQRVLDLMDKGVTVDNMRSVSKACHAAGLTPKYMFIVGFPGSREEDEQQTVEFILQNAHEGDNVSYGPFILEEDSLVGREPARFGVYDMVRDERNDVTCVIDSYRVKDGISQERAAEIVRELRTGTLRAFDELAHDDPLLRSEFPLVAALFKDPQPVGTTVWKLPPGKLWGSSLKKNDRIIWGNPLYERAEQFEELLDGDLNGCMVLDEETYEATPLSPAAILILHLCDGRTGEAVLAAFVDTFGFEPDEIDETRDAVNALLQRLISRGLVTIAPPVNADQRAPD